MTIQDKVQQRSQRSRWNNLSTGGTCTADVLCGENVLKCQESNKRDGLGRHLRWSSSVERLGVVLRMQRKKREPHANITSCFFCWSKALAMSTYNMGGLRPDEDIASAAANTQQEYHRELRRKNAKLHKTHNQLAKQTPGVPLLGVRGQSIPRRLKNTDRSLENINPGRCGRTHDNTPR